MAAKRFSAESPSLPLKASISKERGWIFSNAASHSASDLNSWLKSHLSFCGISFLVGIFISLIDISITLFSLVANEGHFKSMIKEISFKVLSPVPIMILWVSLKL